MVHHHIIAGLKRIRGTLILAGMSRSLAGHHAALEVWRGADQAQAPRGGRRRPRLLRLEVKVQHQLRQEMQEHGLSQLCTRAVTHAWQGEGGEEKV